MDPFILALISLGLATNIVCFCFGMLLGKATAYKMVRPYEYADTAVDMRCAKTKCAKASKACQKPPDS
jgi:hypothetical protein